MKKELDHGLASTAEEESHTRTPHVTREDEGSGGAVVKETKDKLEETILPVVQFNSGWANR